MASAQPYRALPIVPPSGERPLQQAFVLRLSEDSLEALRELMRGGDGGDGMELELGGGETLLHIPNHPAFNLTPTELKPSTEFVTHSGSHPTSSPYHVHSHATTRYTVRQTTVSEATKNKLRLGTEQAAQERNKHKIIQLDEDPVKVKGKKTKLTDNGTPAGSSSILPAHMRSKPISSGSVGGSRGSSPAGGALTPGGSPAMSSSAGGARAGSKDRGMSLRSRVVQLLAMGPMTAKDLSVKVRASEESVVEVLSVIAHPPTSSRQYRLLPKSYTELDIYGWKAYSAADRQKVLNAAFDAFDNHLHLADDAPERRILDPEWIKSPTKPLYPHSSLGPSASQGLGLGLGLGSGKRSASPLPPASPADDGTTSSSSSTAALSSTTKGKSAATNGSAAAKKAASATSTTAAAKGKKKAAAATTTASTSSTAADKASKSKAKRKDREFSSSEDEKPDIVVVPSSARASSSTSVPVTNGDASKRRKTIDPYGADVKPAIPPPSIVKTNGSSKPSPLGSPAPLPAHPLKSHLSTTIVPTPYTTRPSTPLPVAPSQSQPHPPKRKASPTFTSSSASSSRSSSPFSSSHESTPEPLDLPNDCGELRKRFKLLWPEYEALNGRLEKERERSERVLAGKEVDDGKEGAGAGWKEVKRDVRERRRVHRELEEIKGRLRSGAGVKREGK